MIAMGCCETCGAPFEFKKKFDGGRGSLVAYPTCTCDEMATDEYVDRMIEGIRQRRRDG